MPFVSASSPDKPYHVYNGEGAAAGRVRHFSPMHRRCDWFVSCELPGLTRFRDGILITCTAIAGILACMLFPSAHTDDEPNFRL
jgi:hypothetical protein